MYVPHSTCRLATPCTPLPAGATLEGRCRSLTRQQGPLPLCSRRMVASAACPPTCAPCCAPADLVHRSSAPVSKYDSLHRPGDRDRNRSRRQRRRLPVAVTGGGCAPEPHHQSPSGSRHVGVRATARDLHCALVGCGSCSLPGPLDARSCTDFPASLLRAPMSSKAQEAPE